MSARGTAGLALPVLVAVIGGAAMLQGAFYMRQAVPLTAVAVIGAGFTLTRRSRPVPPLGVAVLVLAAGLLASGIVNGWPPGSGKPVITLVFAVACFVLAARAHRSDGEEALCEAIAAVGAVVAAIGLIAVAWHIERFAVPADTWRLASTLTYQNAAGSLFTLTLPVTIALVAMRSTPIRRIALALQAAALLATLSRGALLGAAAGAIVLVFARAIAVRSLAQPAAAALLIIGGLAPALLRRGPFEITATAGLIAGCALAAATLGDRATRVLLRLVAVTLIAGLAVSPFTALRGRLTLSSTDRARVWSQTIDAVTDPVFGSGPGTYVLRGSVDGLPTRTTFAHNEYLQTYVETGAVGLVSVLVTMILVGIAVWRARRPGLRQGPVWAASAAGLTAFAVHSGFDFLWRIPVLPAIAFALIALGSTRESSADAQRDHEPVADGQDG